MQLYYFETMNPRKVCATAKHLSSPVEYVKVDLSKGEHKTPDHLARNPNGKVPVLVDGDHTLWESVAIMAYLSNAAGASLWPAEDPAKQAEVMRWVMWDMCEFAPHAGAIYFERYIKPKLFRARGDEAKCEAKLPAFRAAAKVLDTHLAGRSFIVGDALTIADFCVGAMLPQAEELGLPLSDFPNAARWHDGLMALPAWRDPWPT